MTIALGSIEIPTGGFLIAVFAGWVLSSDVLKEEWGVGDDSVWFQMARFVLRFVAPVAIGLVLVTSL